MINLIKKFFDFGRKRPVWEAVVFYFFYLIILVFIMDLVLKTVLMPTFNSALTNPSEHSAKSLAHFHLAIGALIPAIYVSILTILVVQKRKLWNMGNIIFVILNSIVSLFAPWFTLIVTARFTCVTKKKK